MIPPALEYRPVRGDGERRRPAGPHLSGDAAPRRPSAAFEHFGKRQALRIHLQSGAHAVGDAVEQRHSKGAPSRPDRAEAAQHCVEDGGCRQLAGPRLRREMIEQIADAARRAEERWLIGERGTEATEEQRPSGDADQRVVGRDLHSGGKMLVLEATQRGRIGAQLSRPVHGKDAVAEEVKTGDREPLGAHIVVAARFAIAPSRPGAGIEENAGHGEVEAYAGNLLSGLAGKLLFQYSPAVGAADREMPPAAVKGDGKVGIVRASRRQYVIDGRLQALGAIDEMRRSAPLNESEYLPRPRTHGVSRQQPGGRPFPLSLRERVGVRAPPAGIRRVRTHGASPSPYPLPREGVPISSLARASYSPSPRPFGSAISAA